jgi:hypothetical protein
VAGVYREEDEWDWLITDHGITDHIRKVLENPFWNPDQNIWVFCTAGWAFGISATILQPLAYLQYKPHGSFASTIRLDS